MGQKTGHRQFSREFKRNALQLVMENIPTYTCNCALLDNSDD